MVTGGSRGIGAATAIRLAAHGALVGIGDRDPAATPMPWRTPTQLAAIRRLVADGTTPSVSGFVQRAVAMAMDDGAGWAKLLAQSLNSTGGDLTADERDWADRILGGTGKDAGAAA